ncbi:hypothetical protein GCM10007924_30060 [Sneathiella chinensis]|uniref:Uncharacterized protein n=2 Tax=Sneathiella chinensis TaxID=349750 RepID=A0ABQ5U6K8_9PROT|nr:hypothetical protein GCM10007924_30060 [Sneathiella chinensis]
MTPQGKPKDFPRFAASAKRARRYGARAKPARTLNPAPATNKKHLAAQRGFFYADNASPHSITENVKFYADSQKIAAACPNNNEIR